MKNFILNKITFYDNQVQLFIHGIQWDLSIISKSTNFKHIYIYLIVTWTHQTVRIVIHKLTHSLTLTTIHTQISTYICTYVCIVYGLIYALHSPLVTLISFYFRGTCALGLKLDENSSTNSRRALRVFMFLGSRLYYSIVYAYLITTEQIKNEKKKKTYYQLARQNLNCCCYVSI